MLSRAKTHRICINLTNNLWQKLGGPTRGDDPARRPCWWYFLSEEKVELILSSWEQASNISLSTVCWMHHEVTQTHAWNAAATLVGTSLRLLPQSLKISLWRLQSAVRAYISLQIWISAFCVYCGKISTLYGVGVCWSLGIVRHNRSSIFKIRYRQSYSSGLNSTVLSILLS